MERVSIDDVESSTFDPENRTHDRRDLSAPLNATDVAINRYVLEPGERFSGAVHAHPDQEEVFIVVEGAATFETHAPPSESGDERPTEIVEVTVEENEAIRFAPGEFQSGKNDSGDVLVAFAVGAPRVSEDVRISHVPGVGSVECPDCTRGSLRTNPAVEGSELVCPDCGAETDLE